MCVTGVVSQAGGDVRAPCQAEGADGEVPPGGHGARLEHAITVLGWDRVLFGSNMPIDRIGGTYTELIAALKAVTGEAAPEDQQKFWAGNAERLYRL
ncbi:amidohydrolase family protein [Streptomyces sp. NPDC048386]|uniref:amidohydrolase family protein n=1 Tax=Streptomyces sp. NPDC048386 TaxID=3365541 RepID=UPI0037142415